MMKTFNKQRRLGVLVFASALSLATTACTDGKDGTDGADGADGADAGLVTTEAKLLTVNITGVAVTDNVLHLDFTAMNELEIPVVKIGSLSVNSVQLKPELDGNASQWQKLASETCSPATGCEGVLQDNMDGSYSYTMRSSLTKDDISYNSEYTQRVLLSISATDKIAGAEQVIDFNIDGSEVTNNRNIVDEGTCLSCHDNIADIKHGGDGLENCSSCHTLNNMPDSKMNWPVLVHTAHIGVNSEPDGNCATCHALLETDLLQQALNWNRIPTRETCSSCHDLSSNAVYDHEGQEDNGQCNVCHAPEQIYDVHLSSFETAVEEGQRKIVSIDLQDAKLIDQGGQRFAEISFALLDATGQRISVPDNNPANAEWIRELQLYVNWGNSVDYISSRGYTVYVKTNKQDIMQDGSDGITPVGLRARTPMHSSQADVFTYVVGPVTTGDSLSGDLIGDAGIISNRLIYCFDSEKSLVGCSENGRIINSANNASWFFNKNGLTQDPVQVRPAIVSNERCGSCHGYDEESDNTQLVCRGCHSRGTDANKKHANTTCFSGHDDDDLGNHLQPFSERRTQPKKKSHYTSSTADIVDPCLACHNPNTPPTQAIRELHTTPNDWDYVEQLTVTHPDHKVWMHSLHMNQRATQKSKNGVRSIDYPANKANCYRCHEGDTFGVERLTSVGRPLALDLDYDADSTAYPATDISVDAYTSPVSATCYSCHAKQPNAEGELVINKAVRAHMEQNGGRFGVADHELQIESCEVCHSVDNLKKVHNL